MNYDSKVGFKVKMKEHVSGVDPGFDQGGPQIVTGLKLPFWGLSFVEFWCWGLIFGGQGGPGPPGPPLDPPLCIVIALAVADPGFPVEGRGPPTRVLFGENVCENERIGFHSGGVYPARPLDPPMISEPL